MAAMAAAVPVGQAAGEEFRGRAAGLPPAMVKRLSALSSWRGLLSILQVAAMIAGAVVLALAWWSPLTVLTAMIVNAGAAHGLAILAHEATHYRLFEGRALNDLAGRFVGAVMGVSMASYRVVHRLHHNHLYDRELDPDLPLMAGYPRGRAYLLKRLLRDLTGLTAYKNYAYFFGAPARNRDTGAAPRPLDDTSPRLRQQALTDRWMVAGVQAGMLAAAVALGVWVEYLLLWVLPLLTILQVILRLRAVAEHGAVTDLSSPLTAARTVLPPWYVRWLLFPFDVHYHIEHHLYPSIPHYRLAEAHRLLTGAGVLRGAEVRGWRETLRLIFADPPARPARA